MNILKIEGIGPVNAEKLSAIGIRTVEALLEAGASRKGRQELAAKTDISTKSILEWVNRADLMRVKGIGEEYSDLLEAAGVDTARELGNRNPGNLYKTLLDVNSKKRLVRRPPSQKQVANWISQAKALEPILTY
jgi:predicted flap endonuclease-1-like 5' DNA nuclease